jgi:hypothetical protein
LNSCVPTRQTGWKFEAGDSEPHIYTAKETHSTYENGHKIYNEGVPHPKLATFQNVKNALAKAGILSIV